MQPKPRICFYGDDFTGSTDALESLARAGLRTMLFTRPPTPAQIEGYDAFGVAGMSRAMTPAQMETELRPALMSLRNLGAGIVHYKVCSTFDSSPNVGSLGRVVDIGADVFGQAMVPVVAAAPSLGRYCVFGNLFARCGGDPGVFRLDRHPSMSRHPVTPMDEADLRKHLGRQTQKRIGLVDVTELSSIATARQAMQRELADGAEVVLIDLLQENELATVGSLLADGTTQRFVVGSSGVGSALTAWWQQEGTLGNGRQFEPVKPVQRLVVIAGSCSPVTAGQIGSAVEAGFEEIRLAPAELARGKPPAETGARVRASVARGKDVVIHTGAAGERLEPGHRIGQSLGIIARVVMEASDVRRLLVAGGDTSGEIARTMDVQSLEMVGELVRGAPLCRVGGGVADGREVVFKGGQIGNRDFFIEVRGRSI